jgi:stalled ribosome rescue protein Dom34
MVERTRNNYMKNIKPNAGVWIDHREATIVVLTDTGEETKQIQSNVEKQLRRSGEPDHGSFEAQEVPADDSREREYSGQLVRYYDEIISYLRGAGAILILGPGEAKGELKKRFEKDQSDTRTVAVETADKMTGPQLVALVRHHYHRDPTRIQ